MSGGVVENGALSGRPEGAAAQYATFLEYDSEQGWMAFYLKNPDGSESQFSLSFYESPSVGYTFRGDGQAYLEDYDGKMLFFVFLGQQDGSMVQVSMLATTSEIETVRNELQRHRRNARRRQEYSRK